MADLKISQLDAISALVPATDVLPVVSGGVTKKITTNQILGSSGVALLASATITGDLTVDTSTLKVDSTNNRVGIGTITPDQKLEVFTSTADTRVRINSTSVIATEYFRSGTGVWLVGSDSTNAFKIARGSNFGGSADYLSIASATADCTWYDAAGGTRMTLNSTGLGIGASPSRKLSVSGAGGGFDVTDTTQSTRIRMRSSSASNFYIEALNSAESAYVTLRLNDTTQIDSSGNVGIGVTPSAWTNQFIAIEGGDSNSQSAVSFQTNANAVNLHSNSYYSTGYKYKFTGTAGQYALGGNQHEWYIAPSGTAGTAITFTQAMTLDASGNLLVGTTSSSETSGVGHKINTSATAPWLATVGSVSTNSNVTSSVYSTGAAAYRFYVGFGGTVFATNTTISAISDARFKENVQDIDVGLAAILSLKPRKFDWKAGKGKDIKGDRGFIAQEFETVFPNLIDEWKDPAPEGEAPYKSVRQDLIPVLVKAIQELTARVQTLEAR